MRWGANYPGGAGVLHKELARSRVFDCARRDEWVLIETAKAVEAY